MSMQTSRLYMFCPIRELRPFAKIKSGSQNLTSGSRTGRISANTLNTLHGYVFKGEDEGANAPVYADDGRSDELCERPCI